MKRIKILWFSSVSVSLVYLVLLEIGITFPALIHNFLMDLLCMPVICGMILFLFRFFRKNFYLTVSHLISLTLMYAIYFEVVLPPVSPRYTADIWDVVMYASGTFIFYKVQLRDLKSVSQKKASV